MTERNDTSKISPTNPEYDVANVDDRILNYTKQIRKNMFTDNITEAMARVAELAGLIAGESSDTAKYVKDFYDEVLLAWESDPNKDPEVIAARGGQPQLRNRLENVDRQLAHKASKEEVANALDGSPKGTYATLADLQAAYPTGTTGVYIITADGHIYSWDGAAWTDRGLYQSSGIADKTVSETKLTTDVLKLVKGLPTSLNELPNGVKDTLTKNSDGTYTLTQNIKSVILKEADITGLVTSTTNLDYPRINKPTDYIRYNVGGNIDGTLLLEGSIGDNPYVDSAANINYTSSVSTILIGFMVTKGTYVDLATAKVALAGRQLLYQLSTPITHIIRSDYGVNSVQIVKLTDKVDKFAGELTDNNVTKPLDSETTLYMGDSIIMGSGEGNDLTKYIDERTGSNGINIGYGGGTASSVNAEERLKPFSFHRLADALVDNVWVDQETHVISNRVGILDTMKAVDIYTVNKIVVAFGANDESALTPIGTIGSMDVNTFIGSLRYGIEKLWTANDNMQIVLLTPYFIPNRNIEMQKSYVNAAIEVGEFYNTSTLDLYKTSGINTFTMRTYLEDLLHPKLGFGYKYLGNKVGGWMCSIF